MNSDTVLAEPPANVRRPQPQRHRISVGHPHPLGASIEPDGVNFSVFSQNATAIELLLFENDITPQPFQTIRLDASAHRSFGFWHVFVEGLRHGARYAYRAEGPWDLPNGHRFDPMKVAIDPYARGHTTELWDRRIACVHADDNVTKSMRSVVIDVSDYDWEGDAPLGLPMQNLVIYEAHVGGFTRSPSSAVEHPGTFGALIEKIPYLKSIGVNAVELLPVFQFDYNSSLRHGPDGRELRNFWGYSTVSFFSPESTYCENPHLGAHLTEFRDMVKALHRAGIEVILDVVFNHTDEGNHLGPSMSFRLLDNSVYYHLVPDDKQYYLDYSGCGNTFNCNHPVVGKLIVECLEFWVQEMHVDGFRFDEGSILTRDEDGRFAKHPPVVWAIELSDTLSNTKIIAEAWDAAGAYQIGYFPAYRWAVWNGRYRDVMRRFVRGDPGLVGEVASRISGSADIFQRNGELPINSINFITCHDGFTLNDLVSYNEKHNEANGEGNADGANDNNSWNCGHEGPSEDANVERLREQQIKNFMVILIISQGIPMITAGDEFRRSQGGNNNAYCQDNATGWVDWTLAEKNAGVLRFFRQVVALREQHPMLRRARFFNGETNERGLPDVAWHGACLNKPGWTDPTSRVLGLTLGGFGGDPDLHLMMNMSNEVVAFELPQVQGHVWKRVLDTSLPSPDDIADAGNERLVTGEEYLLNGHSVVLLVSSVRH